MSQAIKVKLYYALPLANVCAEPADCRGAPVVPTWRTCPCLQGKGVKSLPSPRQSRRASLTQSQQPRSHQNGRSGAIPSAAVPRGLPGPVPSLMPRLPLCLTRRPRQTQQTAYPLSRHRSQHRLGQVRTSQTSSDYHQTHQKNSTKRYARPQRISFATSQMDDTLASK